jgi:hypothetical protein
MNDVKLQLPESPAESSCRWRCGGGKVLESKLMASRVQKTDVSDMTFPQWEHTDAMEFGNRMVGGEYLSISQSYFSPGE